MFYSGIIEDRNDPIEIGRYRVRIWGVHSHDKTEVPTEGLPWSNVLQPTTSAAVNGIGVTPRMAVGTNVLITFLDENMQNPLILGSIGGIGTESHLYFNGQMVINDNDQFGFTSVSDSDYIGQSDVSKYARSGKTENLREHVQINNIPGAFSEPPDLRPYRQYPYNNVRQSEAGHVEEWDDTPGNERVLTQHKTGTFTEMRPDGDNVTKVIKDNYTIVAGDNNLYVKGSVNILVEGDVNFTTEGDYNINVGGDYNLRVQGETFEHTNGSKTELVNGSRDNYIVGDVNETIGGDYTSTVVGNWTNSAYGDITVNGYSHVGYNIMGDLSVLTDGTQSFESQKAAYMRGSTIDFNDTTATPNELDEDDKIEVYEQDFESIEADISLDTTSPNIKSTQYGTVDSETYVTTLRRQSTADRQYTSILNGKGESGYIPTTQTFEGGERVPSKYQRVEYSYSKGTKRDGKVNDTLEKILSDAAIASDVYMVEIYSGKQPGSAGRRTGSGRHDTGEAVDIRLIKTEEDYNNSKGRVYVNGTSTEGRAIFTKYVQEAVKLGIRGGGFSPGYMGVHGMHLDTLGQVINTSNTRVASSYDRNVLAVWKSTSWFREAFYTADPDYRYVLALRSGTRYYSKTNTKWSRIA